MTTTTSYVAKAETMINAPVDKVWNALIDPDQIKKYMFGTTVNSDWKEGSKIFWKGEWEGKSYEDKGVILQLRPNRKLQYSHFSTLSGLDDIAENYHIVTIELTEKGNQTMISLSQDNNANEKEKDHSQKNWMMMLSSLKKLLEEKN